MYTHALSHQVEVLAGLTEKEALHPVLLCLGRDVMKSGVPTTAVRDTVLYRPVEILRIDARKNDGKKIG